MAMREFTDRHGREWRVWATHPQTPQVGSFPLRHPTGWLTFQSDAEKRRLAPIPESWDGRDTAGLMILLMKAEVVPAK
ncbi:MAG TPA: hypothetical protein VFH27_01380 [Longimicrobiaceae bacterium]|nr:hypothetical protein [Longimicrobiaceae bacterium]